MTRTERAVVKALEVGEVYEPADGGQGRWPKVRASVIRDLLRGYRPDSTPDPRGLRLCHVRIEGRLNLDHLETPIPLDLKRCELPEGLTAAHARLAYLGLRGLMIERDSKDEAVLHLENLHVGHLDCTGTTLINRGGCALYGDDLAVDSSAVLTNLTATGAVRLLGASITDQLVLTGADLTSETGPALHATGLCVGAEAFLNTYSKPGEREDPDEERQFRATGSGELGAVRMPGASIGGMLILRGAKLINTTGPALDADGIKVGWHAYLDEGFNATGGRDGKGYDRGTVRLRGAVITGRLVFTETVLTNHTGPVLVARNLTVGLGIYLDLIIKKDLEAPPVVDRTDLRPSHEEPSATVDLFGVDAGSFLDISRATLEAAMKAGDWNVTELAYKSLEAGTEMLWLKFLEAGTARYSPQPYRQFAAAMNLAGDEVCARDAHIAQRRHQLKRSKKEPGLLTGWDKVKSVLLGLLVGYGYRSWRAFWLSVGVLAVAIALSFWMSPWALVQPENSTDGNPGGPCSTISLWVLALESVPLASLAPITETSCGYTNTPWAGWHLGINVAAEIFMGAFLTLFIAGYTNIIRKPES